MSPLKKIFSSKEKTTETSHLQIEIRPRFSPFVAILIDWLPKWVIIFLLPIYPQTRAQFLIMLMTMSSANPSDYPADAWLGLGLYIFGGGDHSDVALAIVRSVKQAASRSKAFWKRQSFEKKMWIGMLHYIISNSMRKSQWTKGDSCIVMRNITKTVIGSFSWPSLVEKKNVYRGRSRNQIQNANTGKQCHVLNE